jgi:hypothetical protein
MPRLSVALRRQLIRVLNRARDRSNVAAVDERRWGWLTQVQVHEVRLFGGREPDVWLVACACGLDIGETQDPDDADRMIESHFRDVGQV